MEPELQPLPPPTSPDVDPASRVLSADTLAPIVSAIFAASLDLASIQAQQTAELGEQIGNVVAQLDRVVEDLRRRAFPLPSGPAASGLG